MKRRTVVVLVGVAALVCSASVGVALATKKAAGDPASAAPHAFLEKAAAGGMAEVELGKLAQEIAGSAAVKEFATKMVDDHEKDVAAFCEQATSSADPDVKAFAARTLPVLEGHLKMAKDLQKQIAAG